jgi:hypothetical protein
LVPAEASKPEPIEALTNQGEFPTLVDQGEGIAPGEPLPEILTFQTEIVDRRELPLG